MTKKEIMELTGEDPEDMFGGDWKNEIEEILEKKLDEIQYNHLLLATKVVGEQRKKLSQSRILAK